MKVMERRIQTLEKGKWDVYWAKEQKWEALENRLGGFPAKRHTRPISNHVWERDWESFAAMEVAYGKEGADPETQGLSKVPSAIADECIELYFIVS
jgi:hypothetical protein